MNMKPIPTTYDGVEFRSRLEARWSMFFTDLNISNFYEPWEIWGGGLTYLPDFFLHDLIWGNNICIAEIKPLPVNDEYIKYLQKIRQPGAADFYVFIGNPSFYQPDGVIIYGESENLIQRGFELRACPRCRYYAPYDQNMGLDCGCWYFPPKQHWEQSAEKAISFRFDLANQY